MLCPKRRPIARLTQSRTVAAQIDLICVNDQTSRVDGLTMDFESASKIASNGTSHDVRFRAHKRTFVHRVEDDAGRLVRFIAWSSSS
jgi:hypothetical protein